MVIAGVKEPIQYNHIWIDLFLILNYLVITPCVYLLLFLNFYHSKWTDWLTLLWAKESKLIKTSNEVHWVLWPIIRLKETETLAIIPSKNSLTNYALLLCEIGSLLRFVKIIIIINLFMIFNLIKMKDSQNYHLMLCLGKSYSNCIVKSSFISISMTSSLN